MIAYTIMFVIWVIVAVGIFVAIISALDRPTPEQEQKWRAEEARIRLMEARAAQLPEQTEGIVRRYRQTDENRVNAMLRQIRQEREIEILALKKELLERELGKNAKFEPENPPEL